MSLDHFKHSITYSKIKTDFDYKIDSDMAFLLINNEMEKNTRHKIRTIPRKQS